MKIVLLLLLLLFASWYCLRASFACLFKLQTQDYYHLEVLMMSPFHTMFNLCQYITSFLLSFHILPHMKMNAKEWDEEGDSFLKCHLLLLFLQCCHWQFYHCLFFSLLFLWIIWLKISSFFSSKLVIEEFLLFSKNVWKVQGSEFPKT